MEVISIPGAAVWSDIVCLLIYKTKILINALARPLFQIIKMIDVSDSVCHSFMSCSLNPALMNSAWSSRKSFHKGSEQEAGGHP